MEERGVSRYTASFAILVKDNQNRTLMMRKLFFTFLLILAPLLADARVPEITPPIVNAKVAEIMKAHATYKSMNTTIIKRALQNYLEELDPSKTYFIESDIEPWISPQDDMLEQTLQEYNNSDFHVFYTIYDVMLKAVNRRHELEKLINMNELPKHVNPDEFKDPKWATNEQELVTRLAKIKSLQIEGSAKLETDIKAKALQRIAKRQTKYEEELLNPDPIHQQRLILSNVLKATASALDTHTAYFTPDEASQFMINVQQRLFGIGAQLRDDINGFTVIKVIEGGPAAIAKELKAKDRIIAVNGEPVVGMDIVDAVELMRGEENTPVVLTILRETGEGDSKKEEKLDITIYRGEVVFKEHRYESSYEPFGDGVIAYLRLYSFYQDPDNSSASDLTKEINKIKEEHKINGIILDLRYNSGGMLSQAVEVAGLFITKGIVASIKDHTGAIQHLRDLDGKTVWDGPLIVLVNRVSASASEIVAQSLQDYGRVIIVGDDHTYGKGSFQTFTLNASKNNSVNPQGEYKVTRGKYYTVSGKTPQLTGVISDIIVPGPLSETDIGEKYAKYPLENDQIKENFDDDLSDIPFLQKDRIRLLYKFDLQPKLTTYQPFLDKLRQNTAHRIQNNKNYQNFLKEIKKAGNVEEEETEQFGQNDLQLTEANNIMKDLILLLHSSGNK